MSSHRLPIHTYTYSYIYAICTCIYYIHIYVCTRSQVCLVIILLHPRTQPYTRTLCPAPPWPYLSTPAEYSLSPYQWLLLPRVIISQVYAYFGCTLTLAPKHSSIQIRATEKSILSRSPWFSFSFSLLLNH